MKICLDDPMKASLPGLVECLFDNTTGFYTIAEQGEGGMRGYQILYDNLSDPGTPYFNRAYDPRNLATCDAIKNGTELSKLIRTMLGPAFTQDLTENKTRIGMTRAIREKRARIHKRALETVGK
jgi:hypothetical protein